MRVTITAGHVAAAVRCDSTRCAVALGVLELLPSGSRVVVDRASVYLDVPGRKPARFGLPTRVGVQIHRFDETGEMDVPLEFPLPLEECR